MRSSTPPPMEDKNDEEMDLIIASLPQDKVWLPQPLFKYQNFWFHKLESIFVREKVNPIPNTVVLCTFPKCGTTWFAALLFTMVNRTRYDFPTHPLLTNSPHDCVLWLNKPIHVDVNSDHPNIESNFPIVKSHWPYSLLPQSIKHLNCPIIYVCRNPMDQFVSLWHYINKLRPKEKPLLDLNEAFESYCKGVAPFGPYWDHVLQYWRASIAMPNTVMFIRYEDMKREPVKIMKMMATFLGCGFSIEEEQNGVIERIVEFCSFDKLASYQVNQSVVKKKTSKEEYVNINNSVFFRRGEIGDHKNYLTSDMVSRLMNIIDSKFKDSGLAGRIYANSLRILDKPPELFMPNRV